MPPLAPPFWTEAQLQTFVNDAMEVFRRDRMLEPLEKYLAAFDAYQTHFETLLEATLDLSTLDIHALNILVDPDLLDAFRYLPGPPISADDIRVVAQTALSPKALRNDPEAVRRLLQAIHDGLDRRRFPWVTDEREPTEAERKAAITASAALMAQQRVATERRNEGKEEQEIAVCDALEASGFTRVPQRRIAVLSDAPQPGEFCRESLLGSRKADIVVGMWDRRVMPIECKVSNSAANSIKRLNNDAAVKAVASGPYP